jgi:hypothetical protein
MPAVKKYSDYKWKYFCDCGAPMELKYKYFLDCEKSNNIGNDEILNKPVKCFNCIEGENENKESEHNTKRGKQNNKNRITSESRQSGNLFGFS